MHQCRSITIPVFSSLADIAQKLLYPIHYQFFNTEKARHSVNDGMLRQTQTSKFAYGKKASETGGVQKLVLLATSIGFKYLLSTMMQSLQDRSDTVNWASSCSVNSNLSCSAAASRSCLISLPEIGFSVPTSFHFKPGADSACNGTLFSADHVSTLVRVHWSLGEEQSIILRS